MQPLIVLLFKGLRRIKKALLYPLHHIITRILFYCNNVKAGSFITAGIPYIAVAKGGVCTIGDKFEMNNIMMANPIGRVQPCSIFVDKAGVVRIGNNVGMSFTAISCKCSITIMDNVMIGGGVCIYDSDFHALDAAERNKGGVDEKIGMAAVTIRENAFIGAGSTILKGVTIGRNAVIGACSVVTKSIPDNEIWAGNPARFIKAII